MYIYIYIHTYIYIHIYVYIYGASLGAVEALEQLKGRAEEITCEFNSTGTVMCICICICILYICALEQLKRKG